MKRALPHVPCCRYDNLVGMFSGKQVPAVGISIGIERIFALLEQKWRSQGDIRERETQVCWTVHATLPPQRLYAMFPHRLVAAALQASCTVAVSCEALVGSSAGAFHLRPWQLWHLPSIDDSTPAHWFFKACKDPSLVPAAKL